MRFFNTKASVWLTLSLCLFVLIGEAARAEDIPALLLSDDDESIHLPSFLYLSDPSRVAAPAEVKVKLLDGALVKREFTLAMEEGTQWLAFTLTNPFDHALAKSIYLEKAFPNKVNLHYQQQGQWVSELSGTDIPLSKRAVKNVLPIFNINLAAHESQTFYLEIHSKIKLLQIQVVLGPSQQRNRVGNQHFLIVIGFISIAITMIFLNGLMYVAFKNRFYLYYIGFIASFITATFAINGYDLFFDLALQDRSFLFLSYTSMIIFFSLFLREVLESRAVLPKIDLILVGSCWLAAGLGVMALFDPTFVAYTIGAFAPASIIFLGILANAWFLGTPYARDLILGLSLFLIGTAYTFMVNLGLVPNNMFGLHALLIGALAQMIFFTTAFFRRVMLLNADILANNLKLLRVTEQANATLESTVNERTEELNLAKQAAEQANEARGAFFANLNHEMRTPLSGVLGMIEMIGKRQEKFISNLDLKTLETSGQQLSGLINNVLDHSKLSNNSPMEIETTKFSILSLVEELENILRNTAQQGGLRLNFEVTYDVPIMREGDYGKIRQVLVNLIGNAIKFTPSGQVDLTVSKGTAENDVIFSVIDTGKGIDEEQLEHIFSPYYQVPGSNAPGQAGTGLGLSISKELCTLMGGKLDVKSTLGEGTRFDLCLNISSVAWQENEHRTVDSSAKPIDLSGRCILVVDDSAISRQVAEAFLLPSGITFLTAKDGDQALERFKKGGIDVILMDTHMGVLGGINATRLIRTFETDNDLDHCPIIIHTADTAQHVFRQAQDAGADHCLYKPYTQMQLLRLLSEFFEAEFDNQRTNDVDVSSISPLVDKFLTHCDTSIKHCHKHIEDNNFDALAKEIHQMLGNCGIFGAQSMSATLLKVESSLDDDNVEPSHLLLLLATVADQLQMYRKTKKSF